VYTATYSVTNGGGTTKQASVSIAVTDASSDLSIAAPDSAAEGSLVTLSASESVTPAPAPSSYVWSVSKGGTSVASWTGATFSLTPPSVPNPTAPVKYTVHLTVTNDLGLTGTASHAQQVVPATPVNDTIAVSTTVDSTQMQTALDAVVQPDGKLLVLGLLNHD